MYSDVYFSKHNSVSYFFFFLFPLLLLANSRQKKGVRKVEIGKVSARLRSHIKRRKGKISAAVNLSFSFRTPSTA